MLQEIALDRDGKEVRISEISSALRSWTDRADFADRGWTCPVCGGPMSVKFGNKGAVEKGRETHFFHSAPYPWSEHEPESVRHKETKQFFVRALSASLSAELAARRIAAFEGPRTEEPLCGGDSRADVYYSVTDNDGTVRRYAVEAQYSPMQPEEFSRRHGNYLANGITDFWAFWPDFMKPTKTGKLRPAAVMETVFRTFWHAFVVTEDGFVDYFPPPPEKKRRFEPWSRDYMYSWYPEIPDGFSFSAKKPVDMSRYTVPEFVTKISEYRSVGGVLFSFAVGPRAEYSRREWVASAYGAATEASESLAEAYQKEHDEYETAESERLEAITGFASREAQAYPILAFGILAAFMERAFREFYMSHKYFSDSVRRFHAPFDTDGKGGKIRFQKTSDALVHVLRRLAYVRRSEGNARAWQYLGMDSYVRAYAECFWRYAEGTESAFSGFPATAEEVEKEGRIMCCGDYADDWSDETRTRYSGFRSLRDVLDAWGEYHDETGQLFSGTGFAPLFKNLVRTDWTRAVLSFVTHPDSRRGAVEHVRDVAQLFTWSREYDPETFLAPSEEEEDDEDGFH